MSFLHASAVGGRSYLAPVDAPVAEGGTGTPGLTYTFLHPAMISGRTYFGAATVTTAGTTPPTSEPGMAMFFGGGGNPRETRRLARALEKAAEPPKKKRKPVVVVPVIPNEPMWLAPESTYAVPSISLTDMVAPMPVAPSVARRVMLPRVVMPTKPAPLPPPAPLVQYAPVDPMEDDFETELLLLE